jgi:hypothetical protein
MDVDSGAAVLGRRAPHRPVRHRAEGSAVAPFLNASSASSCTEHTAAAAATSTFLSPPALYPLVCSSLRDELRSWLKLLVYIVDKMPLKSMAWKTMHMNH